MCPSMQKLFGILRKSIKEKFCLSKSSLVIADLTFQELIYPVKNFKINKIKLVSYKNALAPSALQKKRSTGGRMPAIRKLSF